MPPYEATLTTNLRDAGAIIIAKTGMTELANWVAGAPTPMPATTTRSPATGSIRTIRGAIRARQTIDGRPALAHRRLQLGHRHGGQLLGRQCRHRDIGLDPEPGEPEHAGRHQADGRPHQPLRHHPDHRRSGHRRSDGQTVTDAAILLGVLEGAVADPNDPATTPCAPPPSGTTRRSCKPDGLKGARIGIPRAFFYDPVPPAGATDAARRAQRATRRK